MEHLDLIPRIKEMFDSGGNIIKFLKEVNNRKKNTIEDILISYDFQAGSYIEIIKNDPLAHNAYISKIAEIFNSLGEFRSLLEIGVGEATTLSNLSKKLINSPALFGFDISWSRINYGRKYLKDQEVQGNLFVADLFHIPLKDAAIDVVYTSHSLEPNGGREREALQELYRVAGKYLVLFEPTNQFASDEGKQRMLDNGYVQDLQKIISELNYNLIEYSPFNFTVNPLNPTGLYIIKKDSSNLISNDWNFNCPVSKSSLKEYEDHFFSPELCVSYPKIMGIPCLCSTYGVLTSKHE